MDWNAAIDSLRESVTHTQFQNWLKPVEFIRRDGDSVVLGVPNRFHGEWIRNNFANKLTQALGKQCGTQLQLEFEVLKQEDEICRETDLSAPTPAPTLHEKPALRVVQNPESLENPQSFIEAPTEEFFSDATNLPSFNNPYFELKFNQMAHRCVELFVKPGCWEVSPLVIYGGIGMGKTHILAEMGRRILEEQPGARVRYTTAELFAGEFLEALQQKGPSAIMNFKKKYREHTDYLLFDDLHGLSKKMKTQQELVYIFNEIVARGGKIAFATTVAPNRMEAIDEGLRSRLVSGVIAEIQYPSHEDRSALLEAVAATYGFTIGTPVLRSLADQGQKDVRELIGTVVRAHLQAKLANRPLDHEFLSQEGFSKEPKKEALTLDEIVALVENSFGVTRTELFSPSRKASINWARQVAMYLARRFTLLPLEKIGKTFGRNHATVLHAHTKVKETLETKHPKGYPVEFLLKKLQGRSVRDSHGTPL